MPRNKTVGNLALVGFDDIFNDSGERITILPLSEIYPPDFHPFQVNDDLAMQRLVENVKQYGVREPGLARPREGGGYELLCGNRRKRACELAGLSSLPVIIRKMDDDDAVIAMVDSNLEQRETLLFSERAWAYRVKMEALNHNGVKGDMESVDVITAQTGDKKTKIFQLIRLTELVPVLLDKVDSNQLAFSSAVELSYLSRKEQSVVADTMGKYEIKPSVSQAVQLKKLKKLGELTDAMIDEILSKEKKSPLNKQKETSQYTRFFPVGYTQKQMDAIIVKLLTEWQAGIAV